MGITVYSLAISIVFYNLALIAVFILRRSPGFRARHAVSLLAFITVLGVVRLVLPIDFDAAYVVRSYKIIPAIEDFLKRPLAASFTYGHLLLALCAVGSLVMVIKDVRLQRRFDRYLQSIDFVDRPELLEIAAEYGSNFAVLISPQLHMPFTGGILHPVIYLPDVELSDAEWRMVFCHEITHIRSRDNLKKLFFLAVEAVFWWNPLAHFSSGEINTLIELHCDSKVTSVMDESEKLNYIATLKTLMGFSSFSKIQTVATSMIGSQSEMQFRLETILREGKNPIALRRYLFFLILLIAFISSYSVIVQPIRIPTDDDFFSESEVPDLCTGYFANDDIIGSNSYVQLVDGKYWYFVDDKPIGIIEKEEINKAPYNGLLKTGEY